MYIVTWPLWSKSSFLTAGQSYPGGDNTTRLSSTRFILSTTYAEFLLMGISEHVKV
ncbi:protein of unknown function [Candidatus Methylomirabilis oxygeniifera]|uniref:Uncharacterized protein n=1 Tax=Methylomirabilis oxygeniifera TaxID=671143 RepID=D5MMM9_METO1|nr:protein of unknown function [Candidatus Methylomirabilis oxyfera]